MVFTALLAVPSADRSHAALMSGWGRRLSVRRVEELAKPRRTRVRAIDGVLRAQNAAHFEGGEIPELDFSVFAECDCFGVE